MEASPYKPSKDESGSETSAPKIGSRWLGALGVILFTGPIWGLLATAFAMVRAFITVAQDNSAAPEALSQDIWIALYTTTIGLLVGFVGAVLIFVVLFGTRNRERWFLWWSVIFSVRFAQRFFGEPARIPPGCVALQSRSPLRFLLAPCQTKF